MSMQSLELKNVTPKRPAHRPSLYDPELAKEICDAMSTTARGLDYLCSLNSHWPSSRTIYRWLDDHEDFCRAYLRAKSEQATLLFEEALEIADDSSGDTMIVQTPSGPKEVMNGEWVARSKLRVDTRMRMAGKLDPKKYGEHRQVQVSGGLDVYHTQSIDVSALSPEQQEAIRQVCLLALSNNAQVVDGQASEPDDK